jgi:hypothetical protein
MKSKCELPPISLEEDFPGQTAAQIIAASDKLERKYLKAWYTPFDGIQGIARNAGLELTEKESKASDRSNFINCVSRAIKSVIIGSGSLNCDCYCDEKISSLIESKLDNGLSLDLFLGGFLMTKNDKNHFLDDILLPRLGKKVRIFYFPYRLAFHSYSNDLSEISFDKFHYEFSSTRIHYFLPSCPEAKKYLSSYYLGLAKNAKCPAESITKGNAYLIKRRERSFFFDMDQILATPNADKML